MIRSEGKRWHFGAALALLVAFGAAAQGAASDPAAGERQALQLEVDRVKVVGPAEIALRDQARLSLPAARMWIPQPTAGKIMQAMGNRADTRLIGLIYPLGEGDDWMVVAKYENSGHVKDDDARDWNADDLLNSLKEGTAAANEERRAKGFPELEVSGWPRSRPTTPPPTAWSGPPTPCTPARRAARRW